MTGLSNPMWLLADAGTVVTILVLFLYFINWVLQKAGEAKNAAPQRGRPARQLPAPQAKELDDFLKRARAGANLQQAGRRDAKGVFDGNDLLEVVEEAPPRRSRPAQRQTPREPKRQKPKPRPQPLASSTDSQHGSNESKLTRQPLNRPVHQEFQSTVGHSQLSQLQQHLTAYMESGRVDKSVAEHLPSLVRELNLKMAREKESTSSEVSGALIEDANTARNAIIEMFHNPQEIRRAVIVNEILQRPRSLRHD
ncbi:MAG: hypothetical protein O2955_13150 [Planctomycetota bacterium]|nr:hypothetical protein [Planctomycetota bacterium]MDA1213457.1 hypothetical protein [Planctomycetota bacterium]